MTGTSLELTGLIDTKDGLAEEIATQYDMYRSHRETAEDRWKETIQYVYATSTRETEGGTKGGLDNQGWSHSTHIPKLTQIRDNLYGNLMGTLFPNRNWLSVEGEDSSSVTKDKREKIQGYLSTKHRLSKFRAEMARCVNDFINYGNCFAQVFYSRETHEDPISGETNISYAGPRVKRLSPYDIVFNPLADDFTSTPKIVRYVKTLGELARDIEEKPSYGYSQAALEKAIELRSAVSSQGIKPRDVNKHLQVNYDGFGSASAYLDSGYVEVLEFYGDIYDHSTNTFMKNHVVTILDRMWVLRAEPLNTRSGRPHIYHAGWRQRPDNLWAMGPLDNLVGMQYYINHLENAKADAFDRILYAQKLIIGDVIGPDDPHELGAVWTAPTGEGSVSNLAPDTNALNADFHIADKERKMEEFAGSPKDAMGIRSPGEKTAFEVQQLTNASARMFQMVAAHFEETFVEDILNAELEVSQRHLTEREAVRFDDVTTGVKVLLEVTNDDLSLNGRVIPVGARHFIEQNQQQQLLQALDQAMAQDPEMAQHISSVEKALLWRNIMKDAGENLVSPYVRVAEQMELAQRQQIAQVSLQEQMMTPAPGEEDEEFEA